jgi:hypothetical protein
MTAGLILIVPPSNESDAKPINTRKKIAASTSTPAINTVRCEGRD